MKALVGIASEEARMGMDKTRRQRIAWDSIRGGARKDQRMDETRRWRIAWPPKAEVVSYGKLGRIFTRAKGHR